MSAGSSPSASPEVRAEHSRAESNPVVWGAISAVGVLLAGLIVLIAFSLVSWSLEHPAGASAASAAHVGVQAFYLAHGVPLPVSWGVLSVPPLLVTGLLAMFFYRSGRSAVRACALRSPLRIAECTAAMGITYTAASVMLTSVAYPGPRLLDLGRVALAAGLLSTLAPLAGMLRESGYGARVVAALPGPSYAYTRGALAAWWALGAMSALAVFSSLVIGFSETSALTAALSPSGLGGLTVIAISIGYLPNAMLLAVAFGSGAGFGLGDGSQFTLTGVRRDALPTFPLFAALPHETGLLTWLVVLVPAVAAVVGALTMTRHLEREHRTPVNLLTGSVLGSALVALGVLGVALVGWGSLGDGRLASVGAAPLRTAIWLFAAVLVVGTVAAFVATARALTPAAVARRKRALSVIETTAELKDHDGDEVAELETDLTGRPVISTKLAMRRLARTGRVAAARTRRGEEDGRSAKKTPSASLSVVKRAQEAKAAAVVEQQRAAKKNRAAKPASRSGRATPSGSGATPARGGRSSRVRRPSGTGASPVRRTR
ncbi:cell division protein PerM [Cumulibacter manganitolerans]|uniref:cell division protein PerM n=1 Tax=Cumulibacter manganitolerans TaxID=1884992 RepID=UPI0012979CED|nr:DUF6350 family protein [Cumulibacter manganitolerans]